IQYAGTTSATTTRSARTIDGTGATSSVDARCTGGFGCSKCISDAEHDSCGDTSAAIVEYGAGCERCRHERLRSKSGRRSISRTKPAGTTDLELSPTTA